MMKRFLIIILLIHTQAYAQDKLSLMIDSLTFVSTHGEKAGLSRNIAFELRNSDWERTLHYLEYSEKEALASGSTESLASFYKVAADIYNEKDVLDVALSYYQKAYDIYLQSNNHREKFILENDLAIIYGRMNNQDKALHYFKKVYQYQDNERDSLYLAQILNNIGTLYLDQNNDSSEVYYLKALRIAQQLNNIELNAYLYTNLGRVYYSMGDSISAQTYFDKSIALANKEISSSTKSWIFATVSQYYFNIGDHASSVFYALKALELLKNEKYSFQSQDVVKTLYKSYLAENDYKNAAKYFDLYDEIRDSINVEEKAVNIERLKLEQEYKTKNQISLLKEKKKKFTYIIIGLSLISGLLVLIMILFRYKSKFAKLELEKQLIEAKRKELNAHLELKNKVLIAKAMTEIHRTEITQAILEDLKEIKLKAVKKETQNAIDYISQRLEKDTTTNIWKEFELSFEQVHETFYKNLNLRHPDLTSSDRRLCALLKLNLTSKEISQITGQSFKSVENARTRLRKKLGLTNTKTDFVVYLNSLN